MEILKNSRETDHAEEAYERRYLEYRTRMARIANICMLGGTLGSFIINTAWFFFDDFMKILMQQMGLFFVLLLSLVNIRLTRRGLVDRSLRIFCLCGLILGLFITWSSGDAFVFTGFFILVLTSLVAVFGLGSREAALWSFLSLITGMGGLTLRIRVNIFSSSYTAPELVQLFFYLIIVMGTLFFLGISISNMMKNLLHITQSRKEQAERYARELTEKNRELKKQSITDILTGLNNRLKLDTVLDRESKRVTRYAGSFAVILFDIDFFKNVNDRYGHQTGDEVLKTIAHLVKKNIRDTDVAGRWGGEEFLIICPETELESAWILSEKLRKIIADHDFPVDGHVTASFGISQFYVTDTVQEIINRADKALYLAKDRGRNCSVLSELPYYTGPKAGEDAGDLPEISLSL